MQYECYEPAPLPAVDQDMAIEWDREQEALRILQDVRSKQAQQNWQWRNAMRGGAASSAAASAAAGGASAQALLGEENGVRECTATRLTRQNLTDWNGLTGLELQLAICKDNSVAFARGIAVSTESTYRTGGDTYEIFCELAGLEPFPADENKLMLFIGWYFKRVQVSTLEVYLSAVRMRHVERGLKWVERREMPRLTRLLNGYEWLEKATREGRVRMPITFDILERLLEHKFAQEEALVAAQGEGARPSVYSMESYALSSALYCTLFIGLHRPSECTLRKTSKGPVSAPPRIKDVAIKWRQGQASSSREVDGMSVFIERKKVDPYGQRGAVEYGLTGHAHLCAVGRVVGLLTRRQGGGEGVNQESEAPLFATRDGADQPLRPVTYEEMTRQLEVDLAAAGFPAGTFKGHSFRIGGASSLAQNGVPTSVIEDMGGWVRGSLALPRYLRNMTPANVRREMARFFGASYVPPSNQPEDGPGMDSLIRAGWIRAIGNI